MNKEKGVFGAGCFWSIEAAFRELRGVNDAICGYSGGHTNNPTYNDVCAGNTGHAEVVQVEYDPLQITYDELLNVFWNCHNPTTLNRQGLDIGSQYRSVIFFCTAEQGIIAKSSKEKIQLGKYQHEPVVTEIRPLAKFYRAEEYHQRYFEKHGLTKNHGI